MSESLRRFLLKLTKNDGVLPAVTPDKPIDDTLKDSNTDIITQDSDFVKSEFSDTIFRTENKAREDHFTTVAGIILLFNPDIRAYYNILIEKSLVLLIFGNKW